MSYDIKIRGISGWNARQVKPDDVIAEGPDLSTPEARLIAFKEAVAAGNVQMADAEEGGFVIQWSEPNIGFGEVTVSFKDGKIHILDECMSRVFCQRLFETILENATFS